MKILGIIFLLTGSLGFTGNGKAAAIPESLAKPVVEAYAKLVFSSYNETVVESQSLAAALDSYVTKPSEETKKAAQDAWKKARTAYSATEPYRYYGGPIDDPKTGVEGLVNAWPIDEAYIDYVSGNPNAGIVNNEKDYPKITKEILLSANANGGERNVSTGFHAIEFLLWGQDLSLQSAGTRPFTDYVVTQSKVAGRRGSYLKLLGTLLVEHLTRIRDAWDPSKANPYGKLLAGEPLDESLRKIFTGLTNLSIDEMSGERMTVALEKSDQENEQDCFSDYTLSDLQSNERGIHRVYFDTGLVKLIAAVDGKLGVKVTSALKRVLSDLAAIPAPFDNVIASEKGSTGRKLAQKAINDLQLQGKLLAQAGKKMGLILNVQ